MFIPLPGRKNGDTNDSTKLKFSAHKAPNTRKRTIFSKVLSWLRVKRPLTALEKTTSKAQDKGMDIPSDSEPRKAGLDTAGTIIRERTSKADAPVPMKTTSSSRIHTASSTDNLTNLPTTPNTKEKSTPSPKKRTPKLKQPIPGIENDIIIDSGEAHYEISPTGRTVTTAGGNIQASCAPGGRVVIVGCGNDTESVTYTTTTSTGAAGYPGAHGWQAPSSWNTFSHLYSHLTSDRATARNGVNGAGAVPLVPTQPQSPSVPRRPTNRNPNNANTSAHGRGQGQRAGNTTIVSGMNNTNTHVFIVDGVDVTHRRPITVSYDGRGRRVFVGL